MNSFHLFVLRNRGLPLTPMQVLHWGINWVAGAIINPRVCSIIKPADPETVAQPVHVEGL